MTCPTEIGFTLKARFRELEFDQISASRNGGRDIVTHLFPKRDDFFHEDMGLKPQGISLTAIIHGDNLSQKTRRFEAVLNNKEPAYYYNPLTNREIFCRALDWSISSNEKEIGSVTYFVTLIEEGKKEVPYIESGAIFGTTFSELPFIDENSYSPQVVAEVKQGLNDIGINTMSQYGGDGLYSVINFIDDIDSYIDNLIDAFSDREERTQESILNDLFSSSLPAKPSVTPEDIQYNSLKSIVEYHVKYKAFVNLGNVVRNVDYTDQNTASSSRYLFQQQTFLLKSLTTDSVITEIDACIEGQGVTVSSVFENINNVQNLVTAYHIELSNRSQKVLSYDFGRRMSSLSAAWHLHKDPTRAQEIINLNNVHHGSLLNQNVKHYANIS